MSEPEAWTITCYGRETGDVFRTAKTAKAAANRHIRACPEGAMPWAKHVRWFLTDLGVWVSAAGNSWINHHVRPVSTEVTE